MAAPSSSNSAASVTSASATLQAATAKQSVVDAYFEVAKALKKTSEALVTYTNALSASPNHEHLVSLLTNASPLQQSSSRHKPSTSTTSPADAASVSPSAWPQLFAPLLVTLGLGLDPSFRTDPGPAPSSSRQHAAREQVPSFAHPTNGVASDSARRKRSRDSDSEDEDVQSPSSGSPSKDGNSVSAADSSGRKPRSKRQREPKDPLAPKGPPSAYIIYQNDVKDVKRAEHPNESYTQIMRLIAEDWGKLDVDTKKAYTDRADREREVYKEKTREWRESRRSSMSMVGSGPLGPIHGVMGNMSPIPGLGTPFMGSTGFDMLPALSYAAPQTAYTVRPSTADGHPNTRRGSVFEGPSSRQHGMYISPAPYTNVMGHMPSNHVAHTSATPQRPSTASDQMPHPLSMSFTQLSDLNLSSNPLGNMTMHNINPSVLPRSARNPMSMSSGVNFLDTNANAGYGPPMTPNPVSQYSTPDPSFTFGTSAPSASGMVSAEDMMGIRSDNSSAASANNGANGVAATGSRRMSGP